MTRNKRSLQIDRENAKWLGVCAGLANFLEVEPWTVRLVFLGCMVFGGWFLVPLYFIAWYLLDDKSGEIKLRIMENQTIRHFRTVDYRKKLYRNTHDSKLWGICAGIADYLEVSAFTVRMTFMLLTILTGFPILFYFGALLVLEKKPEAEYSFEAGSRPWSNRSHRDDADKPNTGYAGRQQDAAAPRGFSESSSQQRSTPRDQYSQRREFQYCARKFTALQKRLVRLEAYVTSNRFKLQREFRNMSQ